MDDAILKEKVTLSLGKPEALILFNLLAHFHKQSSLQIQDDAERLSLVRVHGALESTLVEPFSKEYDQIIHAARAQLLKEWGTT